MVTMRWPNEFATSSTPLFVGVTSTVTMIPDVYGLDDVAARGMSSWD